MSIGNVKTINVAFTPKEVDKMRVAGIIITDNFVICSLCSNQICVTGYDFDTPEAIEYGFT